MSKLGFWDHVNEMRSRIIKSLVAFLLCTLVAFYFSSQILGFIIANAGTLYFTGVAEAFNAQMALSVAVGFIVAFPYILLQVWGFVQGALKTQEQQWIKVYAPLSLVFFLMGVAFAYFIAIPMAYKFLLGFSTPALQPMITVGSYLSFVANMIIAFGVAFELPLILAFLATIGIATREFLVQKRRHAWIIILIVAAILTPPDVVSQLLLAVPLIVLYELGIIFVGINEKRLKT